MQGETVTRSRLTESIPEHMRPAEELRITLPPMRPVVVIDGKVYYELQPQQNLAYSLTPLDRDPGKPYVKHIGYGGAAGGGKSYLARAVATAAAFKWPGSVGIIFRRTKDEVKANHVVKFRDELPEVLPNGNRLYKFNAADLIATFVNGSMIYFGFLRDFKDVTKYQGPEYDYMIFEEATHYDDQSVRWLVGNRLRATKSYTRPFALYPSNPGNKGHHWYKRLFITKSYNEDLNEYAQDYAFVQAKVEHNFVLQKRDPTYIRQLNTLPEPYRSWLKDGDWEAVLGLALTMLSRRRHLCEPFRPPEHWVKFGAFDWGFAHPYAFGVYAINEDGRIFKLDTVTGRHQQPDEFCMSIGLRLNRIGLNFGDLRYVAAGHDIWADHKARDENVPVIAEVMRGWGVRVVQANISRIAGLNNLRKWLQWEGTGPGGDDGLPGLTFMRTDGNLECFYQLESMPADPDKPEDALKQDADLFGAGGDDMYDETRYAIASRPPPAVDIYATRHVDPWSKEALAHEANEQRKTRKPKAMRKAGRIPTHPEFGGMW